MKPHFLFLFASFLMSLCSWSQGRVLQVENRRSGEKIIIAQNTKVVIRTINNRYQGKVVILADSLIQIDSNVFVLNDVNSLQVPNSKTRDKTSTGLGLLITGTTGVITGGVIAITAALSNFWGTITNNAIGSSSANPAFGIGMVAVGGVTAVSGIGILVSKKQHFSSERYQFSVIP